MAVFCFYGDFCQVLNVLNATLKSDSCVINLKALPAVVSSLTALMKISLPHSLLSHRRKTEGWMF